MTDGSLWRKRQGKDMTHIEAMKLTDPHDHPEPHTMKWTQLEMDYINNRVETAVRQAIEQAQKQEPVMAERESVAVWLEKECDEQYLADRVRAGNHAKEKAAKKRQFQCGSDSHLSPSLVGVGEIDSTTQKQEPVAWLHTKTQQVFVNEPPRILKVQCEPLYTSPPQRQPLTDEMRNQMKERCDSMEMRGAFADGWLSAEAAHGIKGKA